MNDKTYSETGKIAGQKVDHEKELILTFNRDVESRKKGTLSGADINHLYSVLQEENDLYDATFRKGEQNHRMDKTGSVVKKTIRDQLIRTVPAVRKIINFNQANILQLDKLFHHHGGLLFDPNIVLQPGVVATEEDLQYDQFVPPYDFSQVEGDEDFEYEGSYAIPRWGVFGNDVQFVDSHSLSDLSGSSNKYAAASAGVGKIYKMPRAGVLDITLIVRNLSNNITYDINDHTGPSDAYFDLENTLFAQVRGQTGGYLHAANIFDESRRSGGDGTSGTISAIDPGRQLLVNFRTSDSFAEGEDVRILLASYVRALSYVSLMRVEINATVNWLLEKIYVRVL